jgi:hypothetical protein
MGQGMTSPHQHPPPNYTQRIIPLFSGCCSLLDPRTNGAEKGGCGVASSAMLPKNVVRRGFRFLPSLG